MKLPTEDFEVWQRWPQFRPFFNKLELSLRFGYLAGPAGVPVPKDGWYITRPIYNLRGMGLGAKVEHYKAGDCPGAPGDFWCEFFEGPQISLDLVGGPQWTILRAVEAIGKRHGQPSCWERMAEPALPLNIYHLDDLRPFIDFPINIEAVDGRIIEVHLRPNPDPEADLMWPTFSTDDPQPRAGARYVVDREDCDGLLERPRIGFWLWDQDPTD